MRNWLDTIKHKLNEVSTSSRSLQLLLSLWGWGLGATLATKSRGIEAHIMK